MATAAMHDSTKNDSSHDVKSTSASKTRMAQAPINRIFSLTR